MRGSLTLKAAQNEVANFAANVDCPYMEVAKTAGLRQDIDAITAEKQEEHAGIRHISNVLDVIYDTACNRLPSWVRTTVILYQQLKNVFELSSELFFLWP